MLVSKHASDSVPQLVADQRSRLQFLPEPSPQSYSIDALAGREYEIPERHDPLFLMFDNDYHLGGRCLSALCQSQSLHTSLPVAISRNGDPLA